MSNVVEVPQDAAAEDTPRAFLDADRSDGHPHMTRTAMPHKPQHINSNDSFNCDGGVPEEVIFQREKLRNDEEDEERRLSRVACNSQEDVRTAVLEDNAPAVQPKREASFSCCYTRPKHAGDKWKTIGPGGSRVSSANLQLAAMQRKSSREGLFTRQQSNGSLTSPDSRDGLQQSMAEASSSGSEVTSSPPRESPTVSRHTSGDSVGDHVTRQRSGSTSSTTPNGQPSLPATLSGISNSRLSSGSSLGTDSPPKQTRGRYAPKPVARKRFGDEADQLDGSFWHDGKQRCWATFGRLIKALDDTFLEMTAPMIAKLLAYIHSLPPAKYNVSFEKDLRMPISHHGENHSLSFMFLEPVSAAKKFPTILVRNPYGRLTFLYFFYLFAQRGYNVVVQDVRGRGESTGVFDCLHDYDDGQATLDWIISQPWYSPAHGIGLLGMSYNGFVLYSTFKRGRIHPAIKAIVPVNTTSRLSTINYRDGPLHLELIIRWSGYLWSLTQDTTSLVTLMWSLSHGLKFLGYLGICDHPALVRALRHVPVDEITKKVTGVQLNRFGMFMSLPDCEFARDRCASGALRKGLPPAQIQSSWYDIFLVDSLYDYQTLVEKGNEQTRLIVTSEYHVKRYFCYGSIVHDALAHFRQFLRPNQWPYTSNEDRVRLQIIHAPQGLEWVGFPSWPPSYDCTCALLAADGTMQLLVPNSSNTDLPAFINLSVRSPSGKKRPPRDSDTDGFVSSDRNFKAGSRFYVYHPTDPTPSIGGNGIGFLDAGARPQGRLERRDGLDLLVYTSGVLQDDLYVIGAPHVCLHLRCLTPRAKQADFVVRICDVFPSGRSWNICDGVKRLPFSQATLDKKGMMRIDFKLYPTAVRFAKGHRIRIHVASAGFIRWERNINCMGYPSMLPIRFEVLHDRRGRQGSQVILPVVPLYALRPVPPLKAGTGP